MINRRELIRRMMIGAAAAPLLRFDEALPEEAKAIVPDIETDIEPINEPVRPLGRVGRARFYINGEEILSPVSIEAEQRAMVVDVTSLESTFREPYYHDDTFTLTCYSVQKDKAIAHLDDAFIAQRPVQLEFCPGDDISLCAEAFVVSANHSLAVNDSAQRQFELRCNGQITQSA